MVLSVMWRSLLIGRDVKAQCALKLMEPGPRQRVCPALSSKKTVADLEISDLLTS